MSEQPSMPSAPQSWRFTHEKVADLPRLAWLARIESPEVRVWSGAEVRREEMGFFEGTWSGDDALGGATRSSAVFGSGIVRSGAELIVVTPAHTLEPVFHTRSASGHVCRLQLARCPARGDRAVSPRRRALPTAVQPDHPRHLARDDSRCRSSRQAPSACQSSSTRTWPYRPMATCASSPSRATSGRSSRSPTTAIAWSSMWRQPLPTPAVRAAGDDLVGLRQHGIGIGWRPRRLPASGDLHHRLAVARLSRHGRQRRAQPRGQWA